MAQIMQNLGVKNQDIVGFYSENRQELAIAIYAAVVLNATVAPINVSYSERE